MPILVFNLLTDGKYRAGGRKVRDRDTGHTAEADAREDAVGERKRRGDSEVIYETLFDARIRWKSGGVGWRARDDLSSIRTGRANPGMFNFRLNIDYYVSPTPITQLSSINVPRRAWSSSALRVQPAQGHRDAIRNSDLGVNPSNDGSVIRISIPQLTEERRRNWSSRPSPRVRTPRSRCATSRRKAMEELAAHQEGRRGPAEDEVGRAEKDLDKTTGQYWPQIDELVKHKEASCWWSDEPSTGHFRCRRRRTEEEAVPRRS